MTHDAGHWDERYAAEPGSSADHPSGDPDPAVVAAVESLPPGRALDLASGLGRHARWLAGQGWAVTAVDFSRVGIARARDLAARDLAARDHVNEAASRQPRREVASMADEPSRTAVRWVVADVRTWAPGPDRTDPADHTDRADLAAYDLVLCAFVHLGPADFDRVRTWLAPGGHLVVVGHAPDADDAPRNPAYRYDEQQLRTAADGLTIEHLADQDGRLIVVARR